MDAAHEIALDTDSGSSGGGHIKKPESVSFSNPFFTFSEGISFEHRDGDVEPIMIVPMTDQSITMHFPGIIRELSLKEEDSDYVMLDVISQSLDFVCMLRVGDPIPSEVTNGSASWEVKEHHKVTAHQKIMLKLLSWITGNEEHVANSQDLAALMDDPENKKKIDEAFISVAEALGYQKDQKEEVVSLVEMLAGELAYIEALREVYGEIKSIRDDVQEIIATSNLDDFTRESAVSVERLIGQALQVYRQEFLQLDAQTGEIIAVLKNVQSQVQFIRQMRDDLSRRLFAWNDIVRRWRLLSKKSPSQVEEAVIETYRFLAHRFLPAVNWNLVTQGLDDHKNKTESVW